MGLPSINRKSVLKAEKLIQSAYKQYFAGQRKVAIDYLDSKVVKATYSLVSLEQLLQELKAKQADPKLIEKIKNQVEKITKETSTLTLQVLERQIGQKFPIDVFNLVSQYAKDYAETQTGLMISQIDETTLTIVREKLALTLDNGLSVDEFADLLDSSGVFGEKRSLMIARTETSLAHNEGAVESYKQSGVVVGKEWLIASDACDICQQYDREIVGIDEAFSSGDYSPPAHPNCRCTTLAVLDTDTIVESDSPDLTKAENYKPTQAMADEAKLGLKWRELGYKGGTIIGLTRANQLAKRENLSLDTVKRMHSYFSRHEVDKQGEGFNRGEDNYPSKGRVAWALWGGDAGQSWARNITEQLKDD